MTEPCLNLKELFGDRYRIAFDPAYNPRHKHVLDPWMMVIPCRYGEIFPYGGELLVVEVEGHPGLARQLDAIPETCVFQQGDGFVAFRFPLPVFEQVAEIVKPRRRRQVTPALREHLAAIARPFSSTRGPVQKIEPPTASETSTR